MHDLDEQFESLAPADGAVESLANCHDVDGDEPCPRDERPSCSDDHTSEDRAALAVERFPLADDVEAEVFDADRVVIGSVADGVRPSEYESEVYLAVRGSVGGIAAPVGSGKTEVVLRMARGITKGDAQFMGLPVGDQGGVCYVGTEASTGRVRRRLDRIAEFEDDKTHGPLRLYEVPTGGPDAGLYELQTIQDAIDALPERPKLVIFDLAKDLHHQVTLSSNDNDDAAQVMTLYGTFTRQVGVATMLTFQVNKPQSVEYMKPSPYVISGGHQWGAKLQILWLLQRVGDDPFRRFWDACKITDGRQAEEVDTMVAFRSRGRLLMEYTGDRHKRAVTTAGPAEHNVRLDNFVETIVADAAEPLSTPDVTRRAYDVLGEDEYWSEARSGRKFRDLVRRSLNDRLRPNSRVIKTGERVATRWSKP